MAITNSMTLSNGLLQVATPITVLLLIGFTVPSVSEYNDPGLLLLQNAIEAQWEVARVRINEIQHIRGRGIRD